MIKRRKALASLATGIGAVFTLPSWAYGWSKESIGSLKFLSIEEDLFLNAIVDTILPKTDTPGALELGVPALIQLLLKDCQPKQNQDSFRMGLVTTNAVAISNYGKSFVDLLPNEKKQVLSSMSTSDFPDQKNFFNTIKRMTIDGYMQSEYGMTHITKFEMAPNRYYGCVKV